MREKLKEPLILKPDSFVGLEQTPWAGTNIGNVFKSDVVSGISGVPIGESWEFCISHKKLGSVEKCTNIAIKDYFSHPDLIYGRQLIERRNAIRDDSELLVKLIDTKEKLSFQVHPDDSFPSLTKDECGKAEAWLVVDKKPGAGVYLGFKEGVDEAELLEAIYNQTDLENYLQFVHLNKYDYVRVPVATPHAIGGGVTLIEPQIVRPGKNGKTLRISDWGRQYDHMGNQCFSGGSSRELHINQAVQLINPKKQSGQGYLDSLIVKPERKVLDSLTELLIYENTVAGLLNLIPLWYGQWVLFFCSYLEE